MKFDAIHRDKRYTRTFINKQIKNSSVVKMIIIIVIKVNKTSVNKEES